MRISGFQKLTLLDYPGKLACVIFTPGCNFRCKFCHNPEFVLPEQLKNVEDIIEEEDFFTFLDKRVGKLDGVAITGGEPTLQPDLENFIKKIKEKGFLIKLDTNGTNPDLLEKFLKDQLIDFVAMDIKSGLEKYEDVVGKVKHENIKKSIKLTMEHAKDYEFRSTLLPYFHDKEEIRKMGELIKGAKKYYLQNFRAQRTLDPAFSKERSFTSEEINELAEIMKEYVDVVGVRG